MIIPVVFRGVKNLAFWIEILDSFFMRIVTVYDFVNCCFWSNLRFLSFGMLSFYVIAFGIEGAGVKSWRKSYFYCLTGLIKKNRLMDKCRNVSLLMLLTL